MGMGSKKPKVVERDPAAEAEEAAAKAAAKANEELAFRRKRAKGQSLLTIGAQGVLPASLLGRATRDSPL